MWVLIDNYDSFTYILFDYLLRLNKQVVVFRCDEISLAELIALAPSRIIISPGPRSPHGAVFSTLVVDHFIGKIPILGVCLGHQILGLKLGSIVDKAPLPIHGKVFELLQLSEHVLLTNIFTNTSVMRYHSLIVKDWEHNSFITPLLCTADDCLLMMFVNEEFNVVGFQFHPESVGTSQGMQFLLNWDVWLSEKSL